jgi:CheY-like chemotaxis protein
MAAEPTLHVLIVDDVEKDALLAETALRRAGYTVIAQRVDTAAALDTALAAQPWDLILCDYNMPHFSGLEALALVRRRGLDVPFILLSGAIGEETPWRH